MAAVKKSLLKDDPYWLCKQTKNMKKSPGGRVLYSIIWFELLHTASMMADVAPSLVIT